MSVTLNCNILKLTIMSILFLCVFGQQEKKKSDGLCPGIRTVLCVKDVLLDIVNAMKTINDIGQKIEQDIFRRTSTVVLLKVYVNHITRQIRSNLPTSKYHVQFKKFNNINKTNLIDLIKEEYYACSYLYNSIKNILPIESIFEQSLDEEFKKILDILQKNILCNYRRILDVYSETWLSIDKINGTQIVKPRKGTAPSFLQSSYPIIVTRLLEKWMNNVHDFVFNIEKKLY